MSDTTAPQPNYNTFIIVGLGNPGPRYELTRHNIGFLALDYIVDNLKLSWQSDTKISKRTKAHLCEYSDGEKKLLFLKPQTFMNLSGESLQSLFQEQSHWRDACMIAIHDEVEVPLGKIRIKLGGGDAGHNGLKSMREKLGHGDFYRIRLGVGRPEPGSPLDLASYVLMNFAEAETPLLEKVLKRNEETLFSLIREGLTKAQAVSSRPL